MKATLSRRVMLRAWVRLGAQSLAVVAMALVVGPAATIAEAADSIAPEAAREPQPVLRWSLSVINGGQPRRAGSTPSAVPFIAASERTAPLDAGMFRLQLGAVRPIATHDFIFGTPNCRPVVGDFNGDGYSEIGVYAQGSWRLDVNGNGRWDADDMQVTLGGPGDWPVTGDWDRDGKTDLGVVRLVDGSTVAAVSTGLAHPRRTDRGTQSADLPPADASRECRELSRGTVRRVDPVDHVLHFGAAGRPVVGDWAGAGAETLGVFHDGRWTLDVDGDGQLTDRDAQVHFGEPGDLPVVGDLSGDGVDDLGIYRRGLWIFDTNGNRQLDGEDARFELGGPLDLPLVGDWDGDGFDQLAVFQPGQSQLPRLARRGSR